MANGQRPFYKGVNFKQFTNKDGYLKGGNEYKVSEKIPIKIKWAAKEECLKIRNQKLAGIKFLYAPYVYPTL